MFVATQDGRSPSVWTLACIQSKYRNIELFDNVIKRGASTLNSLMKAMER